MTENNIRAVVQDGPGKMSRGSDRRRRVTGLGGLALVGVLVLAGCGGTPEDEQSSSAVSSEQCAEQAMEWYENNIYLGETSDGLNSIITANDTYPLTDESISTLEEQMTTMRSQVEKARSEGPPTCDPELAQLYDEVLETYLAVADQAENAIQLYRGGNEPDAFVAAIEVGTKQLEALEVDTRLIAAVVE